MGRSALRVTSMCKRRGLTIVELIVVLAIIAGLLALLLPAVQSARERAREAVCKNNLHQTNLALAQFAEANKQLPIPAPPGRIGGWMVEILPFIEQQNLQQAIPIGLPVTNARETLFRPPSIYRCPRRTALDGASHSLASTNSMWSGHYVLVPASGRASFLLFDAPVNLNVPWVRSPEMSYAIVVGSKGPHSDGFYFARGFQQGVGFIRNGQEVR
jgi:prepilin-type N-terminal cleavage/methylation domain-containing protein